jgi:hypothetical protein
MLPNYNNKMSEIHIREIKIQRKQAAEESIEQSIANDQGTESIEVTGEGEAKRTAAAGDWSIT